MALWPLTCGHARTHETRDNPPDERLAKGLGWFSIGLGLTQVLAPRGFARSIGVEDDGGNCAVVRLVGLRELACGIGILSRRRPAGWVWARVAGDMMDIALLGSALASEPPRRDKVVGGHRGRARRDGTRPV